MLTVYFDTSFFINLGAAEEDDAQLVIGQLNHLEVRYVLSPYVFTELARVAGRAANHAKALDRLAEISIPPLDLSPDHDWSDLRPGPERDALADLMRSVDATDTYVRAVSAAANESAHYQEFLGCLLGEDAAEIISRIHCEDPDLPVRVFNATMRRQNPDIVRRFGEVQPAGDLWVNNNRIVRQQAVYAHAAFVDGGFSPPPVPNFESLDPQDSAARLMEWMAATLGQELVDRVGLQATLDTRDPVAAAGRGLGLMTGTISDRSRQRFVSSLRDHGHMALFASFADQIDLLQIDGPNHRLIENTPGHALHQMGLAARCFTASRLADIPGAIRTAGEPAT